VSAADIASWVRAALPDHLSVSGSVIGVSASAIRPGRFYIMGLNPGGDPSAISNRIGDPIADRPPGWSAFTHDCWNDRCTGCEGHAGGLVPESHLVHHQKRVIELHRSLGQPTGTILATNAIFARSQDEVRLLGQTSRGAWDWWRDCWPVHQRLLTVVRPQFIVTLGKALDTSAYGFLREEAWSFEKAMAKRDARKPARALDVPLPDNRSTSGRMFRGKLPLRPDGGDVLDLTVVGVPHPSRWRTNEDALAGIEELVRC
jgi:hypothetical protein